VQNKPLPKPKTVLKKREVKEESKEESKDLGVRKSTRQAAKP